MPKEQNKEALRKELARMRKEVSSRGGDVSNLTNPQAADSLVKKTRKALHEYLKENPQLAKDYPDLYQIDSVSNGTSIRTDMLQNLGDQNLQLPKPSKIVKPINNIVPRGGDSRLKAAFRSFMGASDAYAYNERNQSGQQEWKPAASIKEAFRKLQETTPDPEVGNDLYAREQRRAKKKEAAASAGKEVLPNGKM